MEEAIVAQVIKAIVEGGPTTLSVVGLGMAVLLIRFGIDYAKRQAEHDRLVIENEAKRIDRDAGHDTQVLNLIGQVTAINGKLAEQVGSVKEDLKSVKDVQTAHVVATADIRKVIDDKFGETANVMNSNTQQIIGQFAPVMSELGSIRQQIGGFNDSVKVYIESSATTSAALMNRADELNSQVARMSDALNRALANLPVREESTVSVAGAIAISVPSGLS